MKKILVSSLTLCLLVVLTLSGCAVDNNQQLKDDPAPTTDNTPPLSGDVTPVTDDAKLERAVDWVLSQNSSYKILQSEIYKDYYVMLVGTIIPDTEDAYYSLNTYIVQDEADTSFTVVASMTGNVAMSVGFSANVLSAKYMTVVFGDIGREGVFDFKNEKRIDADLSEIHVILNDGSEVISSVTSGKQFLTILDGEVVISDIEFYDNDNLIAKYSDYYDMEMLKESF